MTEFGSKNSGARATANQPAEEALPLLPIQPILKSKIWGGTHFSAPAANEAGPIGESWQVADLEEGVSLISTGPMAGIPLSELIVRCGASLVGRRAPQGRFPFLVKVIDAAQMLSIQVHPDSEGAQNIAGAASKEETWYFLEDKGTVLHGLKNKMERRDFESAMRAGTVTDLLREVPVRQGEVLHVPPGTLHAIGANVFLLEVQEASDTTFRVWDYGRLGLDGKARPLHVEEALQVASLEQAPPACNVRISTEIDVGIKATLLAETRCYRMEEITMKAEASFRLQLNGDTCVLATPLQGNLSFSAPGQSAQKTRFLESILIPASTLFLDVTCETDATLILVGLGGCPLAAPDGIL